MNIKLGNICEFHSGCVCNVCTPVCENFFPSYNFSLYFSIKFYFIYFLFGFVSFFFFFFLFYTPYHKLTIYVISIRITYSNKHKLHDFTLLCECHIKMLIYFILHIEWTRQMERWRKIEKKSFLFIIILLVAFVMFPDTIFLLYCTNRTRTPI